jgi:hypothetical protein
VQSFAGLSTTRIMTKFTVSDLRLPQPRDPGLRIYIPQEQGSPVIPPDTGFPFHCLLRLAGLRYRHLNPPPRKVTGLCLYSPDRVSARAQQKTPLPLWMTWYHVFQCSGTVCLAPDCVATLLPAALLLCDVIAVSETMRSPSYCLAMAVFAD